MQEKIQIKREPPRSPAVAGILAAFFPFGVGAFYNRQYLKGIIFLIIFAGLVTMQTRPGDINQPFSGILLAGFYFFQIFDAIHTAKNINRRALMEEGAEKAEEIEFMKMEKTGSIFWGIVLIVVGGIFLLANFDVIDYGHIFDFWPLVVIVIGLKLIVDYIPKRKHR